jgi:hypothetical protein
MEFETESGARARIVIDTVKKRNNGILPRTGFRIGKVEAHYQPGGFYTCDKEGTIPFENSEGYDITDMISFNL